MANETDRTVPNNKSDIIICNNEKGTCVLNLMLQFLEREM